ncbi:MAG: 3-hydroxyacyl-CoA dehydrogenase/enoyl-CoA hydratase family protein [Bacteroidia bacterium]|nr:3-hydroxyacyl-CoA dehydrogenase/enoyl-CoA hydratase family protein [Bacteroidia bacterium]
MNRIIKKVAVLGSGIMGSRIACHFANIGLDVVLLDIPPGELTEEEKAKNLSIDNPAVRNRIVARSLLTATKSKPAPLYKKEFASRITTGNFEDDLDKINDCDWVIEAVIEDLNIKNQLFEKVEKHRKDGSLITTNTSGIPINMMIEGRSEDFQKHFCGTHFFNPPRYLRLLEIIPSSKTDKEIIDFLMKYGDLYLGKTTVLCKDTPAFIGNRIGIYSIMSLFHLVEKMELTVDEVDTLTGPLIGRPKSATFRTCDVVGNDTLVKVADFIYENCKDDEARELFRSPEFVSKIIENSWFGDKTKQGFYKKTKNEEGKTEILSLDFKSFEYQPKKRPKFASLETIKPLENLNERLIGLAKAKDKAGEFFRASFYGLFQYASNRIPVISNELFKIDQAMKAGFGWELGLFETWDALGVSKTIEMMEKDGFKPAGWVNEMITSGCESFYNIENGIKQYYDIESKSYKNIPGIENFVILENLSESKVWDNSGTTLKDIGDGILNLEFHTKMNTIGSEIIEGINKAIAIAEKDYKGLVIGNEGAHFSVGANLGLVFMYAIEQEFDEIEFMAKTLQGTLMKMKYCNVPVVAAPHGMTLGGGCELCLHADKLQAAAETYIGLVEFGVGLIPAGGGTKEFALRASDDFGVGDIELSVLKERFLSIGMAKVSTSGYEAYDLGIFKPGKDQITINKDRLIADAKTAVIELADKGYKPPAYRRNIKVLGQTGLGMFESGVYNMRAGNFISDHDLKISKKLAYVICGGDLSASTQVSEQYLLDLEREAFLSLCGEKKTLERIQHTLKTGKPLRN